MELLSNSSGEYGSGSTGSGSGSSSGSERCGGHQVSAVQQAVDDINSSDADTRIRGAEEIRRLTKTSHRCRRQLSTAISPLVDMLRLPNNLYANESALLALLNLAVKDQQNKISIVASGALEPIFKFLESSNKTLQEHAAASLLTLSASYANKPAISTSKSIRLLVSALATGTPLTKADCITTLHNLSTHSNTIKLILDTNPVPPILALLRSTAPSSRTADKCTALLESLASFGSARTAIVSEDHGVLEIVEVLESGSPQGRERAVGTLLKMCESNREKYREAILREGVIPGLLEMTVQGSLEAQGKAKKLLGMLREEERFGCREGETLEEIVCGIMLSIDGEEEPGKAKKMLEEMVKVSMEQSLRHLQERALVCASSNI